LKAFLFINTLFTKRCSYLQDTDKVERLKNSSFLLFVLILKFQSVSIVNLRSFVTYVDTSETIKITFSAFYFKKVDRFLDFRYLIAVVSWHFLHCWVNNTLMSSLLSSFSQNIRITYIASCELLDRDKGIIIIADGFSIMHRSSVKRKTSRFTSRLRKWSFQQLQSLTIKRVL
jgi:hypothetical protein